MATETEVKIRVDQMDLPSIRARLLELGFRQTAERAREENLLMDFADQSLTDSGSALRIRKYGTKQILTYKGPRVEDPHLKIREEIETEIGDLQTMKRVFEAVGMTVCFEYGKYREKYRLQEEPGSTEVCIDETPVGCFVEIEGSAQSINKVATELGWASERFINKSYIDLYRERSD